ncbi:MAG: homoserine O-succinyltransferase [Gammaproteobacteria bacterium]|nr:homoserine O-succinyltransferase [Gammaproteobacteria bacterium]
MPLISHSGLPTFARLANDGLEVLDPERARHQDIRELHVGLLNMMPDAALEATERQFMRLLAGSNRIVQMYVHPFTVPGLTRGDWAQTHIDEHYQTFDSIRAEGLDALIITGANVTQPDLAKEPFYPPMCEVFAWARDHVASTLCSCLASHALWLHEHGLQRQRLAAKRWGVFGHQVVVRDHPLVVSINTRFNAPHSRFNDVSAAALQQAGNHVLVTSEDGEVLVAVSADGISTVYLQGHPEYDVLSLAKEYKREIGRFVAGDRDDYPDFPDNYLDAASEELLIDYQSEVILALQYGAPVPTFPEHRLIKLLDNTWADTGKAIFNNWLGLVYRLTHQDRHQRFMETVDPGNPLRWSARS